ncbi:glycosyl transferase family 2 [Subtercola sp. Z020]|uniref:glycosyltransferase family 2 protein n=1 Tax=Subtercola sp. Z020 TaxID=2080582 RepID=UPI000CE8857A|nr:glycosyltransferase family A protein [Subtercola sp. Z020]PPF85682.1 glycosyl transferase family 2 [Subtercola sp. Z020]
MNADETPHDHAEPQRQPQPQQRTLAIAVLTFRRPDDLRVVLPLLVEQLLAVGSRVKGTVLVVDNDPAGSGRSTVDAVTSGMPAGQQHLVDYVHEPTPGIAAARNRALDESRDSDLLVFIDDDERPTPEWLSSLLEVQSATGCAAVAGPVTSEYEIEPGRWITAGRFFERRRLADRTPITVAATNNLLLDMGLVTELDLRFDTTLGVIGGEDTLFTRQIVDGGGTMFWAAGAGVVDVVPRARITKKWVVLRAFSSGNSWSVTSLMLTGGGSVAQLKARLVLTARGLVRAAAGTAQIVAGIVLRSLAHRARGTRTLARGAGMVGGAWGYSYEEYRRA